MQTRLTTFRPTQWNNRICP